MDLWGLPRNLFLPYGFKVVMRFVHLSSLSRLICPAQDHFILLVVFLTSVTPVFALTQVFVFLSWYVILSILLYIFVSAAARFLSMLHAGFCSYGFVGRADMYMNDGLHLSGKGAAVFADKLSAAVDSDMGTMTNIFGSKHCLN